MSLFRITSNASNGNFYLEEPSPLSELDQWVEIYIQSQQRFTFMEEEVLKPLWSEGEDIRLREDSRFQTVTLLHQTLPHQWCLSMHKVANQVLYELLLEGDWDGQELHHRLELLDREVFAPSFHIFCLHDSRFSLSKNEQGHYSLSLTEDQVKQVLTLEQKSLVEQVAPQLLAIISQDCKKPWSTTSIAKELKKLSQPSKVLDTCTFTSIEHWLLHQEDWSRVGIDTWLPKSAVPVLEKKHRYAVMPVFSTGNKHDPISLEMVNETGLARESINTIEEVQEPTQTLPTNKVVRWRVTLRTVHINEGYLPIPKQARTLFPHARQLSSTIALTAIWFSDANEMSIWLDREKQQLYGPDLQEQFAFLEAGTVIEIKLTTTGLVFYGYGVDSEIAEEEMRLVDLTELAQLRSTILESYRASLRDIMTKYNKPINFQALYEELCNKQQHKPNRGTIRSILSSSPEFVFLMEEGKWVLDLAIPSEIGVKRLLRTAILAHHSQLTSGIAPQEPLSLSQMIAKNRQQIINLRSMYVSAPKGELPYPANKEREQEKQ